MGINPRLISVIIPTRNEEKFIASCLDSIILNIESSLTLEILVVDGMSEDRTQDIVRDFSKKYPFVRLLINENRTVPFAMNSGIENSFGDVIVRIDAHAIYPTNYIKKLVDSLDELGADNVGGLWITVPGNDTLSAKAIALILSNSFGVGNALYRTGVAITQEVDTVPFGCYRRDVFERIGLYDEMLTRNQDCELNARLKRHGGKIILIPDVKITYFARENFSKMFRMLFQYGYFKPLVNIKIGKITTWRQLVPPVFVSTILLTSLGGFIFHELWSILAIVLITYLLANILVSISITMKRGGVLFPFLVFGFFIAHLSYGAGYIKGLINFIFFKEHTKHKNKKNVMSITR